MATNLALDDRLIEQVRRLGGHKTKREAVNAALREYIQHRKQLEILDLAGSIEFDPAYDYKAERKKRGERPHRHDDLVFGLAKEAGESFAPQRILLDEWAGLVKRGSVVMIGPIRQELLSGIRDEKSFDRLRKKAPRFPR